MTNPATLIGLAMMAALGYGAALLILWRRPRPIKLFALALVTVGLGYLATTEVPLQVSRTTLGQQQ